MLPISKKYFAAFCCYKLHEILIKKIYAHFTRGLWWTVTCSITNYVGVLLQKKHQTVIWFSLTSSWRSTYGYWQSCLIWARSHSITTNCRKQSCRLKEINNWMLFILYMNYKSFIFFFMNLTYLKIQPANQRVTHWDKGDLSRSQNCLSNSRNILKYLFHLR